MPPSVTELPRSNGRDRNRRWGSLDFTSILPRSPFILKMSWS